MSLDIRFPIGLLFLLVGALLGVYGLVADPAASGAAASTTIDAWWGAVMMAFGAAMLSLALRHRRRGASRAAG